MESLTSLPPDRAVLADPSARGPAPLLRPRDADGASTAAAAPFELCLALLTGALPTGEVRPPSGKELPVLPLETNGEADASGLAPAQLPAFAPTALADAALQARLCAADASQAVRPAAGSVPLPHAQAAIETPPASSSAPPPAAASAPPLAELDPLAALATAAMDAAPLEAADLEAASATTKTTPAPSWLEAFTAHERRTQRPIAAPPSDRQAGAQPPTPTTVAANPAGTGAVSAVPETSRPAQGIGQRAELPKGVAVVAAADGASVISTDWLPPATAHAAATSAASTPAASTPQAPVDLRSPGWQEALAGRVQYLVDTNVGEAHIKLNPPELGAVDVKISLVDDKTYVQLTTATVAARDELTQSLPRLRELLTVSGLELGGASVHGGRDGQPHGGRGHGADSSAVYSSPFRGDTDEASTGVPRRSRGRIDVFA